MRRLTLAIMGALALTSGPVLAERASDAAKTQAEVSEPAALDKGKWVILGSRAGPLPSPVRSQPANLLVVNGANILVDVGDGTTGRLAALGIPTAKVDAVFLSHLHWDHTGGLAALLGLRAQTNAPPKLRIYGPPGTKAMVDGILASMEPGATAGYGVPGARSVNLAELTDVIEIRDNASFEYRGMTVSVRKNTHYSFPVGSELEANYEALSFRFDLPGRSIVYIGDTGPSTAVEELAKGADLLIVEMMDIDDTVANVRRMNPNMPEPARMAMERHLRDHHVTPIQVGEMASRAGVGGVVVTHFIGRERDAPMHFEYLRQINQNYKGPVVIANDLDAF